jgi:hypothetical protein
MEILFLYLRQYEYFQQLKKQIRNFGKIESMELSILPFYSEEAMEILPEYIVLLKIEIHSKNLNLLKTTANIKRLSYRIFHLDKRRVYLLDIFNELSIPLEKYESIINEEKTKSNFTNSIRESKSVN